MNKVAPNFNTRSLDIAAATLHEAHLLEGAHNTRLGTDAIREEAMNLSTLAIGCAAGFGGDRDDAAGPVVETLMAGGMPAVLIYEMLAERTLAQAQLARRANPQTGFAPLMERAVAPVLAPCVQHGIPIVSNFGAANPRAAAHRLRELAQTRGIPDLRIAVVEGDDLSDAAGQALLRPYLNPAFAARAVVSANVYLGGVAIAEALRAGAQIVVTGRWPTRRWWWVQPWRTLGGQWMIGIGWPVPRWLVICSNVVPK